MREPIDIFDPLCISLVHQHLLFSCPNLSQEFSAKYKPKMVEVGWEQVLSKWEEAQLTKRLAHQHLQCVAPSLVDEFNKKHGFLSIVSDTRVTLEEVVVKWKEEQMINSLVYQHLKAVAPDLAIEFNSTHNCFYYKDIPQRFVQVLVETQKENQRCSLDQSNRPVREIRGRSHMLGMKKNKFSKEEVARIEDAISLKHDIAALAKELGRSYKSVHGKIASLRRQAHLKKGKMTMDEVNRIYQAAQNKEDYALVAKELGRDRITILTRMNMAISNPHSQPNTRRPFSLEEDLLILEKVIPHLKFKTLSSSGFLSETELMELATEFQRGRGPVKFRWESTLQPWLLQHLTGTSSFKIEKMLTRVVAEKFTDLQGISWSNLVKQHKEFSGHTGTSLGSVYRKIISCAKAREGSKEVNPSEVARYAAETYQPAKEPALKVVRRENIIQHFEDRVKLLEINVVV